MKNQKNKNKKTKPNKKPNEKNWKENGIKDIEPYIYANLEDKKTTQSKWCISKIMNK